MYFTKLLEVHKVPTNIDINERLWSGRFGANGTSLSFIWRNRFLYLGTTLKLWAYWMYFTIKSFRFFCYRWKKKLLWRKAFRFGHHSLAFLNSFLNILNKDVLILKKYNFEWVICFIHEFVLAIFWGRRAERRRVEGRGSRNRNILLLEENNVANSCQKSCDTWFRRYASILRYPLYRFNKIFFNA